MTSWVGFRQAGVPYTRDARRAGETKYPTRRMIRFAVDAITSFSTTPIRIVTAFGLVAVALCIPVVAWAVYIKFFTDEAVNGWTSVLIVVLLLGGMQLVAIGVIGQYISRIFEETKQRPLYLVDESVVGGTLTPPTPTEARVP